MTKKGSADEVNVRDRRTFRDDGSRRGEDEPGSEASAAAETAPDPPEAKSAAEPATDERFVGLVTVLYSQASAIAEAGAEAAREAKDPEAHRARRLEALQEPIGILEMLEEKTRGRLATADSRFLKGVLFQLRMKWVAIRQGDA